MERYGFVSGVNALLLDTGMHSTDIFCISYHTWVLAKLEFVLLLTAYICNKTEENLSIERRVSARDYIINLMISYLYILCTVQN
jgi:hypothetical protein